MGHKARPARMRNTDTPATKLEVDLLTLLDAEWTDATRPKALYESYVSADPLAYATLIATGLQHEQQKVRNGCAELASLLSEEHPSALYEQLDLFVENLASKQAILRWEAACTLGNLARVDRDQRIPSQLPALIDMLSAKSIVLQGHAVKALAKIAAASPPHAETILEKLIAASGGFPGNRVGYVVEAMEPFLGMPELAEPAKAFAQEHAQSDIKSVATKARRVLKRAHA